FAAQAAGELMRASKSGGAILNLADVSWERPAPSYVPYAMSKAALVAMTRGMARALAPKVRVNAIAPGAVLLPEDYTEEQARRSVQRAPLGRVGTPEDIA